jgi:hypothetical protein
VSKLNGWNGSLAGDKVRNAPKLALLFVVPKTKAMVGNATPGLDVDSLGAYDPRPSDSARSEVHEMPIVWNAGFGRILTHG